MMMQTTIVDNYPEDAFQAHMVTNPGMWADIHSARECIYSTVEPMLSLPLHSDQFIATVVKDWSEWYLSKDSNYRTLIAADEISVKLDMFLTAFLASFVEHQDYKPRWIHFTQFTFPGEVYTEPMIVFHFFPKDPVEGIPFCDDFLSEFRLFLAKNAANVETFKALRISQRKFRFIVRRG